MKVILEIDDTVRDTQAAWDFMLVVKRDGGFVYLDEDGQKQVLVSVNSVAREVT